ncbi:MAG: cytochrome d ubiquinol oxidase subunit II [Deltaproteobacteria bacterium]|jgi:cytochrome d ubiquinol oxidase subunit II|nr:cytochrome d ubiquinol oxidase subunit II [Deltaproteobacteria bacterium]
MEWLQDVWFVLWGVLWGVYFLLDGYDFGVSMWLPLLGASSEKERTAMYKATGPFWDGNEVWLITAGGVTFAAFPLAYAVLFSSLYTPLLILLFCLILRGVIYELRFQVENRYYRLACDGLGVVASLVATILLGVAFSNLFRGLPLEYDASQNFFMFRGNILNLLHPYCLLGGVLFVLLFLYHGAVYLAWRVKGELRNKALYMAKLVYPIFLVAFLLFVALTFFWVGYFDAYLKSPLLFALPVLCAVLFLASAYYLYFKNGVGRAILSSCGGILTMTLTGVMGMYPNLIPSRLGDMAANSVSLANGSSTSPTLTIMLCVAGVMVPVVIIYQIWAHRTLSWTVESDYQ